MVVFGGIAHMSTDGVPQALFYMAGNVCWFYFSDCLNQTSSTFVTNQAMFGKVYFPRMVVPISTVISNLLRFAIQILLFVAFYLYFWVSGSDVAPNWAMLLMPLLIVMLAGLGLGFGILVSSLTTKYRDLTILFTFIVQLWMYATPIVYPLSQTKGMQWLGIPIHKLMCLNPVTPILETFKYAFTGVGEFNWLSLGYSFAFSVIILLLGIVIFNRVQRNFMDVI